MACSGAAIPPVCRMEELLQGPETDALNQRLVDLLEEVSAVLSMLDLTAPDTAHRMKTCRLDDVDSGAVPDADHWRMAIEAMCMTGGRGRGCAPAGSSGICSGDPEESGLPGASGVEQLQPMGLVADMLPCWEKWPP